MKIRLTLALITTLLPTLAMASQSQGGGLSDAIDHPLAILCLIVFFVSYLFVMTEEHTGLRKSKPVMLGAGIIWIIIGLIAPGFNVDHEQLKAAIYHDLDEYGSLLDRKSVV